MSLWQALAMCAVACLPACGLCAGVVRPWRGLAPPEVGQRWILPAQGKRALPIWGHARGVCVGLWPMPGPRGLIRVYTPYLGQRLGRPINYIAIEPIARSQRGRSFSELEWSELDDARGKRLWSADSPEDVAPRPPELPARGTITSDGDVEWLTVYVFVEPFRSGARVYLRLRFRSDRPHEFALATFACEDSAPLDFCIVTATMGNWARLRVLHLREYTKTPAELWPNFTGTGFTPHARFPLEDMVRTARGHALFLAAPDEENPSAARYAPGTPWPWKYQGQVGTQYWRCERPSAQLVGQVNARYTYYNTSCPIPGGLSFENFELVEPFRPGNEYWFGVTPLSPEELRAKEEAPA